MTTETGFFDIHSHILPQIDDGSASVEESRQLFDELVRQGVSVVAATPHFYADKDNPVDFLQRRNHAVSVVQEQINPAIRILPGAEVYYYTGISQTEVLPEFAIASTSILLIEMPFSDWTQNMIREVLFIQKYRQLQVVLAHIERYPIRKYKDYLEEMCQNGVLLQVNADSFTDKKTIRTVLKLLKMQKIHFIGSDCHNMQSRMPKLQEAYSVIEKKLGITYLRWLKNVSRTALKGGMPV